MSLSAILSFFGCNGKPGSSNETIKHPPFSIQKKKVVNRRFKINEGAWSTSVKTKYKIFYKDQVLSFPPALDEGTGVPGIWKTYILKDAPSPTLIVASKNVYLISEENNTFNISQIEKKHSNYASIQWLDSENGNPGSKTEILIGEDTTNCMLEGGKYLLINDNTVLRVKDLKIFNFKRLINLTLDYYPGDAIAFSPDKTKIVFLGNKSHPARRTEYIYALIVFDYNSHEVYTIPFDRTATRFHETYNIKPDWFKTYFHWEQNEQEQSILSKKQLNPLPKWEGYHTRNYRYQLSPVKQEMHTTFFNFVKDHLQLEANDFKFSEYGGLKEYTIEHQGFIFNVGYLEELQSVSLSISFMNKGNEKEAGDVVKNTGDAFNETLRKGEHQSLFTSY